MHFFHALAGWFFHWVYKTFTRFSKLRFQKSRNPMLYKLSTVRTCVSKVEWTHLSCLLSKKSSFLVYLTLFGNRADQDLTTLMNWKKCQSWSSANLLIRWLLFRFLKSNLIHVVSFNLKCELNSMTKKFIDKQTADWKGKCVKWLQIQTGSCWKVLTENMYPKGT